MVWRGRTQLFSCNSSTSRRYRKRTLSSTSTCDILEGLVVTRGHVITAGGRKRTRRSRLRPVGSLLKVETPDKVHGTQLHCPSHKTLFRPVLSNLSVVRTTQVERSPTSEPIMVSNIRLGKAMPVALGWLDTLVIKAIRKQAASLLCRIQTCIQANRHLRWISANRPSILGPRMWLCCRTRWRNRLDHSSHTVTAS
jgi:hypothetical protein